MRRGQVKAGDAGDAAAPHDGEADVEVMMIITLAVLMMTAPSHRLVVSAHCEAWVGAGRTGTEVLMIVTMIMTMMMADGDNYTTSIAVSPTGWRHFW